MASVVISKIKVRRGTDTQRKNIVLDQGELGYTTDTNRLYVGNGVINGGIVVGSKIHPPLFSTGDLTSVISEVGDIVWVNGIFYQLISSDYTDLISWRNIGTLLDSEYFEYDGSNQITLKNNVIKTANLADEIRDVFSVQVDNSTIEYVGGNILRLKDLGITKEKLQSYSVTNDKLSPDVIGNGLQGSAGSPISLKIDKSYFYFTPNGSLGISLSAIQTYGDNITTVKNLTGGIVVKTNSIDENYIKSSMFGNGISGGDGNKVALNVDNLTFGFNPSSKLKLNTNSIDEIYITSSTFGKGLVGGSGNKATLNIDPTFFNYNTLSALTLLSATIDHNYINFASFGDGIQGGSGDLIKLKVKEGLFDFEVGKLRLSANSVTEKYINSNAFDRGIIGGNNQKISVNATNSFSFTSANELELRSILEYSSDTATISSINSVGSISLSSGVIFPRISWDEFGRLTDIKTSIVEVLTGNSSLSGFNVSNSLSSIFNGYITQGPQNSANITRFTATDHRNNTYVLSSAGFLAISDQNTSLSGQRLKRFAIPIFAY
jgi:hypothetical protein